MKRVRNPSNIIYLLVQALLFFVGAFIMNSDDIANWIGNTVAEGIGISLVATGIAGTAVYLHVKSVTQLKEIVSAVISAGILHVFPARSARIRDQYDERLRKAKEIDVLALGLSNFRQDYHSELEEWCRNTDIRILVLDPDFPDKLFSYSKQRDVEEGNPEGQIRSDVETFIAEFRDLVEQYPDNFQIRKYKVLPTVNILRVDDEMFWGPYIIEKASRNMPTFIVKKGGYLFRALENHFEAIWSNDKYSQDI